MGNTLTSDTSNHFLTVEEARSRLTGEEYHRIHTAFNRFKKPALSFDDFCYHLLGNAPIPIEEQRALFLFFTRGADSLTFEDLLCALVGLCQVEDVQKSFSKEHAQSKEWRPPLISPKMDDSFISFYEVMSYVTHLSVGEVMELEKVFATISDRTVCKMSKERWDECLGGCFPEYFSERLFRVFDENKDGHIDFRELVCGLSAMCRGPFPSRLSFLAKLWDEDNDNELLEHEVQEMYRSLNVAPEHQNLVKSGGNAAALVDFATWVLVNESYTEEYYRMAVEVGHICLGLRPESYELEHGVVSNFEERTRDLDLPVWNIVASTWHKDWKFSTEKNKKPPPVDNSYIKGSKDDDGWSGKVACISPESASLRSDLQRSEYVVVSPALWRAWLRWHGSAFSVDGQFTRKRLNESFFDDATPGLELYPLDILLMGHDRKKNRDSEGIQPVSPWACAQVSRSMTVDELLTMCTTELRLREGEARLWLVVKNQDTNEEANTMLDDGQRTLYQLGLRNKKVNKFLLEVRDQSNGVWPEELRASLTGTQITSIASNTYSARPGAVGLVNSGNFCYRNAAIQCLARIVPLTDFLLDENNLDKLDNLRADILASLSLCNRKSLSVTLEYAKLIQELWAGKKKNIVPNSFNDAVRNASDMFDSFEQHDCQEFVSFLLDQLQMSIQLLEKNEKPNIETECKDDAPDQEKAEVSWNKYLERENSLVARLLAGQLRSRLICRSCQNSSTVFEPYTSISLPIGFDNVELYQIIVAPRDGSIPKRFGFRLPRETSVGQFKTMVSYASKIDASSLTLQCVGSRGTLQHNGRGMDSSLLLREFPANARLYALEIPNGTVSWRLGAHRKLQYNHEPYLLGSTGGCLISRFGLPLIISCSDKSTNKDLYDDVMQQIRRFMDLSSSAFTNRAMDPCEDASSGYPFSLCITDVSWEWCGQCVALNFCRGCKIEPNNKKVSVPENCRISVDWLPIALYLKYNHSQELACIDDPSVDETWNQHVAPSSLGECLQKFSCPETLEELLHCDKCERKTQRDKVMSIWRMPKYLIVHLKRFEYLRNENRMGKCKRTIDFPLSNFDPSPYVDQKDGGLYDCIAIANHYGQLSSGHFVSYAIGKDKKWLLLNDCSVREVSELDVDKAAAYLLFYERKETTKEY